MFHQLYGVIKKLCSVRIKNNNTACHKLLSKVSYDILRVHLPICRTLLLNTSFPVNGEIIFKIEPLLPLYEINQNGIVINLITLQK